MGYSGSKDLSLSRDLTQVAEEIEKNEWRPHTWYNNVANSFGSEETMELDVQNITGEHQQLLTPFMIQAGSAYNAIYSYFSQLNCAAFETLACKSKMNEK